MSQDSGKTDRTESRFGNRLAALTAPKSQPWLIQWENPISAKDRFDAVRKIPNLTRADKEVLRQLAVYSMNRCHAWIHFDALVRDSRVRLRQVKASLKKFRSLGIVLTWTVKGDRTLRFEIVWWKVGELCGSDFPRFVCPHRPVYLAIQPSKPDVSRSKRLATAAKPTQRQLVLPLAVDGQGFGAAPAPKVAPSRLNFSAEVAPKNRRPAGQDQCRNRTEFGAGSALANKEEEVEREAEAATTDAAADLVRRMTKAKPTYSQTVGRRLAEQQPESFRRVLAQVEAADDPEIFPDNRISWCIAYNELLSTPSAKPKRETDEAIAKRLRGHGRMLPTCVERCMSPKLQERFRSEGYDGLTAGEQADAREADRRASQ